MANINFIRLGAVLGALTVVIGAFGAHGLKPHLSEYQIAIYEKGVQYQFYHSLAILLVGILLQHMPDGKGLRQGRLVVSGRNPVFFRFSLSIGMPGYHSLSGRLGRPGYNPLAGFCSLQVG